MARKSVSIPGTTDKVIVDVPEGASREDIIDAANKEYEKQMGVQSEAVTRDMRRQDFKNAAVAGTAKGLGGMADLASMLSKWSGSKVADGGLLGGAGMFALPMQPVLDKMGSTATDAYMDLSRMAGLSPDYNPDNAGAKTIDYGMQGFVGGGGPSAILRGGGGRAIASSLLKETGSNLTAGAGATVAESVSDSPFAPAAGRIAHMLLGKGAAMSTRGVARGLSGEPMQGRIDRLSAAGVPPTMGTVSGNPVLQVAEKGAALSPGGYMIARSKGTEIQKGFEQMVDSLAGGRNLDTVEAGLKIRNGLFGTDGWFNRTIATRNRLYSNLDGYVKDTTPVPASATYSYLSAANKGIPGARNMSKQMFVDAGLEADAQSFFQDIYDNGGSIPYAALKRFRTAVFDKLDQRDLLRGSTQQEYSNLRKALTADMEAAAKAAGPEAEKAFAAANKYNRLRSERIEDYLSNINNALGGEDVYRLAIGSSPNAPTKLFKIKNSLKPDEWQTVRQTVLSRMGRMKPGAATMEQMFSSESFLTNYEQMALNNPRALDALFGSTKSPFRQNVDTVVKAMGDIRKSSEILANPSKTAGAGMIAATISAGAGGAVLGVLGVIPGAQLGMLAGAVASTAGTAGLEWLLTNRRATEWLAQATKISAKELPSHINRLGAIAANNPEMADEAIALRDYLRQSLGIGMSARR